MVTSNVEAAKELLELVIELAPRLRQAGVASVDLEGIGFELRRVEPEADPPEADDEEEHKPPRNPLDDPDTFGGRRIPGRFHQDDQ